MSLVRYSNVIHPMHRAGMSISRIHRRLQSMDPSVTYYKVQKFLKDHYACQSPRKRTPYPTRKFCSDFPVIRRILEDCYSADSSVTIAVILKRLKERNIVISPSQVRRLREKLGYRKAPTKYCHIIRDTNKEKRLQFCTRMIENHEDFSQCIFTDETTVQVGCATKHCFVKQNDYFARLRSRAKHPAKIHLWGGISMRGPTELAMFAGEIRMDSQKYCEIIERCYMPFATTIYNGYGVLVQDNAPAHKSAYTTARMKTLKIKLLDWPPESPDLNPIELVWGSLKSFVRKQNPRTVEELRKTVAVFWKSLTPAVCTNYIMGMQKKLYRVIKNEGGHIYEGR
ncbi:hypothetical protein TELCIR_18868 [Teladorsagia circumcincta]|uniref:Tc1-like transposase DDE domain-containing protein n=1 Tax=Teladorsagia circumcincta TaxID=45464 RepID=A0A2G9TP06_TELCI|nr:hypothetical protein TELCIR_18868 [Teladorsagia circumcincta]